MSFVQVGPLFLWAEKFLFILGVCILIAGSFDVYAVDDCEPYLAPGLGQLPRVLHSIREDQRQAYLKALKEAWVNHGELPESPPGVYVRLLQGVADIGDFDQLTPRSQVAARPYGLLAEGEALPIYAIDRQDPARLLQRIGYPEEEIREILSSRIELRLIVLFDPQVYTHSVGFSSGLVEGECQSLNDPHLATWDSLIGYFTCANSELRLNNGFHSQNRVLHHDPELVLRALQRVYESQGIHREAHDRLPSEPSSLNELDHFDPIAVWRLIRDQSDILLPVLQQFLEEMDATNDLSATVLLGRVYDMRLFLREYLGLNENFTGTGRTFSVGLPRGVEEMIMPNYERSQLGLEEEGYTFLELLVERPSIPVEIHDLLVETQRYLHLIQDQGLQRRVVEEFQGLRLTVGRMDPSQKARVQERLYRLREQLHELQRAPVVSNARSRDGRCQ